MLAVNYSTYRNKLKEYCDRVTDDNETVIVTRKSEKNVVVMSLDEYNNMMESLRILKNPSYFIELFQSLQQLQQGGIVVKTIEELEAAEQ
ncbi:MAG: type II toxin-antitoxin system Phd/YefM family antitoxin [Synergistaceae bacterium]|jgi:antitoxin YefM|nr:type II toxin-antitoxin system Phd/YefM family antitoxin [Synergistaceae bacterium]MDD3917504.1 type II toxin-antitoxin system Phd/YefM family antitoxin [Synergistaceae bacterium]NLD97216.1 type II toxin-antitoxin system Phd/YefM family antitoxin [Synergistaceae bacterium]HOO87484.1 type II toxin-antitoxin system Phd/YefM family antitoxin [Synergistales bacterium]HRV98689.1 type II toxin-antitoxin system Phd/YefM family antitoxin [Aminobacteriaceae bacterium]